MIRSGFRSRKGSTLAVLVLAATGLSGNGSVARAGTDGLTVADAVAWALGHSYGARIARLESDKAENAVGETTASYLPHLSVTTYAGYSNRFDEKLRAIDGNGVERRYGLATLAGDEGWVNVYIDQLLFDLSHLRLIQRERLSAEAARLGEVNQREALAYEVTQRYADLVRLDELAAAARAEAADGAWLDEMARILLKAGRTVSSDRQQVALYLAQVRLDVQSRAEHADAARAAFRDLLGDGGPHTLTPVPASLPRGDAAGPGAVTDELLSGAPDLQVLALRREMEEASVASAKAGRLPKLKLRAGYSHYGIKRFDNFPDEAFVGVGMDVPLFDGFKSDHAVEGAERAVEIADLRYREALEQKRQRVRDLHRRLRDAEKRAALAAERADTAREQQRLTDLRLQSERGTLAEALAARERSAMRTQEAVDARYEAVDLWAMFHRATGQLTDAVMATERHEPAPMTD
jgi:outer membrane protein TolC